jgi:hypothetical protein
VALDCWLSSLTVKLDAPQDMVAAAWRRASFSPVEVPGVGFVLTLIQRFVAPPDGSYQPTPRRN